MSQSDFVTRGQALVSSGQYQEAVKVCRLGLLGRPTTVEGRVVLGQALLALKRYDEVLAEMRVALELDHTSISAQVLKGEALLRKGDSHTAVELLARLRTQAPSDPRVVQLLGEAERSVGRPIAAANPSIGFISQEFTSEQGTKNYPHHQADEEDTGADPNADLEDSGGSFTRPTSLAAPGAKKSRVVPAPSQPDGTPSPAVLAVGDRSGTVEVDPDLDGVEVRASDDDLGDLVAPPISRRRAQLPEPRSQGERGSVKASSRPNNAVGIAAALSAKQGRRPFDREVSTVELEDEEMVEVDAAETLAPPSRRAPGPGTAVRNAVKMPSGPLDAEPPAALRQTMLPPAQMIVNQPHVMHVAPPPQPLPPAPHAQPRGAIAAAMPTAAAMPVPNYARPTVAISAPQPDPMEALLADMQQGPAWARSTMVPGGPPHMQSQRAAADEPTTRPGALDPNIQSMLIAPAPGAGPSGPMPAGAFPAEGSGSSSSKPLKTGMRKTRSRLRVALWVAIGAAVIGIGVFAGFQIRAMRLRAKIADARDSAVEAAQADTWQGWMDARNSLASIAQASPTADNKAAFARSRAVLAYEFGDGVPEAKAAIDLAVAASSDSFDLEVAEAYYDLAQNDVKAVKDAVDQVTKSAPDDAATLYVSGQAQLLAGDPKTAVATLKKAKEKEDRALYNVGVAHALAAVSAWDEALAALDHALSLSPENPSALIEKGFVMAAAGRIRPGGDKPTTDLRAALVKVANEGAKPLAEQTARGVSPAQVAFAELALVRIDFARNDLTAVQADFKNALGVGLDDQRFAEQTAETLLAIGELKGARSAAERALSSWPASRRARTTLAQVDVAEGKPTEALDLFRRSPEAASWPYGMVVRGQASAAAGDTEKARADFAAALKKAPNFEPAVVALAWLEIAAGDVDAAKQQIEPKFNPNTASPSMVAVYAAIQRLSGDAAARDKAKALLDKIAAGSPSPDTARAQLELARLARDMGDLRAARAAYAEASRSGNFDAQLESGLLQIEDRDPIGGRETLEALLKDSGENAPPQLLLEVARARALVGDHVGATALLERADKLAGTVRWQLDRERARVALRRGDTEGAAQALARALDNCGSDLDTFLLAADTVATDEKATALATKLRALVPARLKGKPEVDIITGKLALGSGNKNDEAEKAYESARDRLEKEKASPRRAAQAHFGLGVIAYFKQNDPRALNELELVLIQDPSIYAAYSFEADILKEKNAKKAFELADKAVQFNPDHVESWQLVGTLAARLGNRKRLTDAITKVGELAPGSDALRALQQLR